MVNTADYQKQEMNLNNFPKAADEEKLIQIQKSFIIQGQKIPWWSLTRIWPSWHSDADKWWWLF